MKHSLLSASEVGDLLQQTSPTSSQEKQGEESSLEAKNKVIFMNSFQFSTKPHLNVCYKITTIQYKAVLTHVQLFVLHCVQLPGTSPVSVLGAIFSAK